MKATNEKSNKIISSNSSQLSGKHVVGFQLLGAPKIRIPLNEHQFIYIVYYSYDHYLCLINTKNTPKPSLQFSMKCPYKEVSQYLLLKNSDLITTGNGYFVYYEYKKNSYKIKFKNELPIIDYYLRDGSYFKIVNDYPSGYSALNKSAHQMNTEKGVLSLLSNNRIAIGGGHHIETIVIYNLSPFQLIKILEFNNKKIFIDEPDPTDCMYTRYYHDPNLYSINQIFQPKNLEVMLAFTRIGRLLVFDLEKYLLIKEETFIRDSNTKEINQIFFNEKNNLLLAKSDEKCFMINVMNGANCCLAKIIDLTGNYQFHQLRNENQVMLFNETSFVIINARDLQIETKNNVTKNDKAYKFFEFNIKGTKEIIYIGTERMKIYEMNTENLEMKLFGKTRYPFTFAFANYLVYLFEKTLRFYEFKK